MSLPQLPPTPIVEGLGLEGLAAALAIDTASLQAKLNKDAARSARKEQQAAIAEQVYQLKQKAEATRDQAYFKAGLSVVAAVGSACGDTAKAATAVIKEVGTELANGSWGAEIIEREAKSTAASARAKDAEADRDELQNNVKAAQNTIEKAHQALQAFAQERQMARRAILRAG